MSKVNPKYQNIDEYFAQFPQDIQEILGKLRQVIHQALPGAVEAITYDMPTFQLNGHNTVYFATWKNHIGFYALEPQNADLHKEVEKYLAEKGTIQIPLSDPIPYELISKLIEDKLERESKNNY